MRKEVKNLTQGREEGHFLTNRNQCFLFSVTTGESYLPTSPKPKRPEVVLKYNEFYFLSSFQKI